VVVAKMVTKNILNWRMLKNNGDGNIMRGAGARDGHAKGAGGWDDDVLMPTLFVDVLGSSLE